MIGALAAAAASVAASALSNHGNASQASKNRRFQENLSGTAHQREVKDLRAAGLNPILSATGGGGASTPSGAVAPVHYDNPATAYADYKSKSAGAKASSAGAGLSAASTALVKQNLKNAESSNALIRAQSAKTIQDARLSGANADQAEVMKSVYRMALPAVNQVGDWVHSAYDNPGGVLQGIWDSLKTNASQAYKEIHSGVHTKPAGNGTKIIRIRHDKDGHR